MKPEAAARQPGDEKLRGAVDAAKQKGNAAYAAGDFSKAVSHYTVGIRWAMFQATCVSPCPSCPS